MKKINISKLARALKKPVATVHTWFHRGRVPAQHCIAIERATQGQMTRYQLRPDVFGDAEPISLDLIQDGYIAEHEISQFCPSVEARKEWGQGVKIGDTHYYPIALISRRLRTTQ